MGGLEFFWSQFWCLRLLIQFWCTIGYFWSLLLLCIVSQEVISRDENYFATNSCVARGNTFNCCVTQGDITRREISLHKQFTFDCSLIRISLLLIVCWSKKKCYCTNSNTTVQNGLLLIILHAWKIYMFCLLCLLQGNISGMMIVA